MSEASDCTRPPGTRFYMTKDMVETLTNNFEAASNEEQLVELELNKDGLWVFHPLGVPFFVGRGEPCLSSNLCHSPQETAQG